MCCARRPALGGRGGAGLAGWAPVRGTFAGAVALVGDADGGVAAEAGAGCAAVDEQVLAAAAGRAADRAVAVDLQELLGERGELSGAVRGEGADGEPGVAPSRKQSSLL